MSLGWGHFVPRLRWAWCHPQCQLIVWVELVQMSSKSFHPMFFHFFFYQYNVLESQIGFVLCMILLQLGHLAGEARILVVLLQPELRKVTLPLYSWVIRFNGSYLHRLKAGFGHVLSLLCLRMALSAVCKAFHIQCGLQVLLKSCSYPAGV